MAKFYGSVSNQTEQVKKLYGPAKATIDDIETLTLEPSSRPSITGVDKTVLIPKLNTDSVVLGKVAQDIEIVSITYILHQVNGDWHGQRAILFSDGTTGSRSSTVPTIEASIAFLEEWGATGVVSPTQAEETIVTISGVSYGTATRLVTKLYGSVNGRTRMIYQA